MDRAKQFDFHWGRLVGGGKFYPYQACLGFSIRYWPCIFTPAIMLYLGPFMGWVGIRVKR